MLDHFLGNWNKGKGIPYEAVWNTQNATQDPQQVSIALSARKDVAFQSAGIATSVETGIGRSAIRIGEEWLDISQD